MSSSSLPESLSAARRQRLREADRANQELQILDSYPLENYYKMAERLLQEFDVAMEERRLDDAYVYGIRFATFSVEALPKHAHYHKIRQQRRRTNARQVDQVLRKLEQVTARMDAEELIKQQQQRQKQQEETKRKQQIQKQQLKRQQQEKELKEEEEKKKKKMLDIERRAYEKLRLLQTQEDSKPPPATTTKQQQEMATTTTIPKENTTDKKKEEEEPPTTTSTIGHSTESKQQHSKDRSNPAFLPDQSCCSPQPPTTTSSTSAADPPAQEPVMMDDEERTTIALLHKAVSNLEMKLSSVNESQETQRLWTLAKEKLNLGDRQGALRYLALRKRLQHNLDAIRAAMFTMETQILFLESASENRQVQQALDAAETALSVLQSNSPNHNLDDLAHALNLTTQSVVNDLMSEEDEEELLTELQESSDSPEAQPTRPEEEQGVEVSLRDVFSGLFSLPSIRSSTIPSTSLQNQDDQEEKAGEDETNLLQPVMF